MASASVSGMHDRGNLYHLSLQAPLDYLRLTEEV